MTYQKLPQGYTLLREIEWTKEPGLYRRVLALGLGITAVMMLAALPFVPLSTLIPVHAPTRSAAIRILLLLPAFYFCTLLHELIRSALFHRFGGKRNRWRRIGVGFSVGSETFYDRPAFLIILASPAAIPGMVLMILNFALPLSWFWFLYLVQIVNLADAAGNLVLMQVLSHLPRTVLIRDDGERMEIYARAEKTK